MDRLEGLLNELGRLATTMKDMADMGSKMGSNHSVLYLIGSQEALAKEIQETTERLQKLLSRFDLKMGQVEKELKEQYGIDVPQSLHAEWN